MDFVKDGSVDQQFSCMANPSFSCLQAQNLLLTVVNDWADIRINGGEAISTTSRN